MTKNDAPFYEWFDVLCLLLRDNVIEFRDQDSVKDDYEDGKSAEDVAEKTRLEYADD